LAFCALYTNKQLNMFNMIACKNDNVIKCVADLVQGFMIFLYINFNKTRNSKHTFNVTNVKDWK